METEKQARVCFEWGAKKQSHIPWLWSCIEAQKLNQINYHPAIPLLGIFSKELKIES